MMRPYKLTWIFIALGAVMPGPSWAQDPFMGAYEGTYQADQSQTTKAMAKVIAEGPGYYRVVIQAEPLAPGEPTAQFEIYGVQQGTKVNLFGRANASRPGTAARGSRKTTGACNATRARARSRPSGASAT